MLILSIDGGGVRGIAAAKLISRLEAEVPGWIDQVDLFTGASTGGIIALALAAGMRPAEIVHFYYESLPAIFDQSWWRRFSTLWNAKYSSDTLRRCLEEKFGDAKLKNLPKKVLIPTYYLGQVDPFEPSRPKFFDTDDDPETGVANLALWTSSAPTIFPSADGYVDGGLSANNCAVCALAYAENRGFKLSQIKVLSISTGRNRKALEGGDKGLLYWGSSIPTTIIDGGVDVAHYQAQQLLEDEGTYYRLDSILDDDVGLDDVDKLDYLLDFADDVDIQEAANWLRKWTLPEVTS